MGFSVLVDSCVVGAQEIFSAQGADRVQLCDATEIADALLSDPFDGLVVRSGTRVDRGLLQEVRTEFVATATVGVDHVDEVYLSERGIHFAHAAGSSARTVAEFTLTMAITALNRLGRDDNCDLSIAVIGHGAIGSRVACAAREMGWCVLPVDPPLQRAGDDSMLPLSEAIEQADIVTLHVPLTRSGEDRTLNMVNEPFLSRLKPGALLINTARGAIVDEEALLHALATEGAAGAALDVFCDEPTPDERLLQEATVVTPHVAGRTLDGLMANTLSIGEQMACYLGHTNRTAATVALPSAELASIGDGSRSDLILKTWDLCAIEETLRAGDFAGARRMAQKRRDLGAHDLPSNATEQQRRFHKILKSL